MSRVVEITAESFSREVLEASEPVLADFYAPWCGPCRMLAPVLEQLAEEFDGQVKFVKVNVDDAITLAEQYDVSGVPTLMIFKGGMVLDTIVGLSSLRVLVAKLKSVAGTAPKPAQA